jgi:hypothetical protein
VGELFITGPQVARGYLNDPEQTSKVFVDNVFRPGSLMYATGDLVRASPSNFSINFLGRRDSQIKIHGLRVEVEEIENILKATSESITNAAVLKIDIGHDILVAFLECPPDARAEKEMIIVHDDGVGPLIASLRYAVRRKLPSYMAPAIYATFNRFPITTSGKLDRNSLRTSFYSHEKEIRDIESTTNRLHEIEDDVDHRTTPQTELQGTIRSLWASVLRIDECSLGMDDDFYSVGGNSISAIHLARAARVARLHLPVIDIIRNPTIRAMAHIASSSLLDHDNRDDDDTPSNNLAEMAPHDLTLLDTDDAGLNRLKDELLHKHGLSPRSVVPRCEFTVLYQSFTATSWTYILARFSSPDFSLQDF